MIQQDTQPLRAALERLATEAERMAALVDGASVSFHMGRRDAFRDAARLAASWEDAALAAAPVAWCEACGFAHAAGWPDCIDAAPVAEGQEDGLEDALRELIRVARSAGMSEGSDFGYLPSQRQADAEEISEAVQGVYRALAAPPSPPATVAEGQERCTFQCDGDAGHEGPHFFWYDGPHPIGPLPEAPPSPPAGIDWQAVRGAISNAYYEAREAGETMEAAADHATAHVRDLVDAADAAPESGSGRARPSGEGQ